MFMLMGPEMPSKGEWGRCGGNFEHDFVNYHICAIFILPIPARLPVHGHMSVEILCTRRFLKQLSVSVQSWIVPSYSAINYIPFI